MKKLTRTLLAVAVVTAVLLTACGSAAAQPVNRPPLKVSWNIWPGVYPLVIAQEKGFFAEHNVQVQPVPYQDYSQQVPDLAANKLDGATIAIGDVVQTFTGDQVKVVMLTDLSLGADQIVATPDIKTLADLRGKSVGVAAGTYSELFVREMLKQGGIAASDVKFVNVALEKVPDLMPTTIQAGHSYEPYTSQAVGKGNHVLFTSADVPGLFVGTVAFRAQVVKERPDDIRNFQAAWYEAVDYWKTHADECAQILAKATGQKPTDITTDGDKVFTLADDQAAFNQKSDLSSISFTAPTYADFFASAGTLSKPPQVTQLIDASFLK